MSTPLIAPSRVPATRSATAYQVRLVSSPAELRTAQVLRFEVFNLELVEGLVQGAGPYATGAAPARRRSS